MRGDIKNSVATLDATLARLRSELAALEAELPQGGEPAGPKFDPEKHPLLRKTMEKQEPDKAVAFSTGDIVEAQWTDRSWYKAKIQSILGSVSAPKYLIKFIEYDESLTVDRTAVRPVANKRKRDAEPASAPAPPTPVTSTPHVISGPASMNPNAQAAMNNTVGNDLEKKPSRIANKQTLKKRQGTWQDFQAQGAKKGIVKKDSMFRTSTTAGSRGKHAILPRYCSLLIPGSWLHGLRQGHDRDPQAQALRPQGRRREGRGPLLSSARRAHQTSIGMWTCDRNAT
jgi:survival-of-motor-neuron-related-splicing factor 30